MNLSVRRGLRLRRERPAARTTGGRFFVDGGRTLCLYDGVRAVYRYPLPAAR